MFKKLMCFALALIAICSCSLTAFADMEGPYFEEIEVTVDNPDGIKMYQYEWIFSTNDTRMYEVCTIPDGTKLTFTSEYMSGGVEYLSTTYGEEYGYVKASDVRIDNKDVVKPTKDDKVDEKFRVITINPDGAKLRSGPSNAHHEVATVPAGTEFDIEYVIGGWGAWAYVTYNGTSGWLHFYEYEDSYDCINLKEEPGKTMVVDNSTYLTKTPDTNSPKVSEAIPYGTVFNYTHIYHEAKADIAYVEYNGIKGWLRTRDSGARGAAYHRNDSIFTINPDGLNVYSDVKDSDKVICKIPYNTIVPCEYELYNEGANDGEICSYVYVSYNGMKGWIRLENWAEINSVSTSGKVDSMRIDAKSIPVYKEPNANSAVIDTLQKNDKVCRLYGEHIMSDEWFLISNDGYVGWIPYSDNSWEIFEETEKNPLPECIIKIGEPIPNAEPEFKEGYDKALPAPSILSIKDTEKVTEKNTEETTEETSEETSVSATTEAETQPTDNTVAEKTISPQMLIILCVAAAAVCAVTAAVIIVIVIKKRKK